MATRSQRTGDDWNVLPGTCNQTGNRAPRVPWMKAGHALIILIAYHLGYDDDRMGIKREFPPGKETGQIFVRIVPWYPQYYNDLQKQLCEKKGYPYELTKPFSFAKVHGRLHYAFTTSGRKLPGQRKVRKYGMTGPEHPKDMAQQGFDRKRMIWARCSPEMEKRIKLMQTISRDELERWSRRW